MPQLTSKWLLVISAATLLIGLNACDSGLDTPSGTYVGEYSLIENNAVQYHQVSATIDPNLWNKGSAEISLIDQTTHATVAVLDININGSDIELSTPILADQSKVHLTQEGSCATSAPAQPGGPSLTTLCAQADVVSLFTTDATGDYRALLYLSKNPVPPAVPSDVKNGAYGLNDLFSLVLSQDYTVRTAADKLYQAEEGVELARPLNNASIGASSIVTTIASLSLLSNPIFAASALGTLVPFIFPSNWFTLDQQQALYDSQVMGYKALVANQMNVAEVLYHQIIHDREVLNTLSAIQVTLQAHSDDIALRVQLGYSDPSDLTTIEDLVVANENSIALLQQSLTSEYASLSDGLGLSPTSGIQDLVPEAPIDFSKLAPINATAMMAQALSGSLEVQQTLYMERAAAFQEKSVEYSFLNPGSWITLDLGIFHQVDVSESQLQQVQELRESTQNDVQEQLITLAASYNQLLQQNLTLAQEVVQHQNDLNTVEASYDNGTANILQVNSAFESMIQLQVQKVDAENAFAIANGKLNRLLWRGPYLQAYQMTVPEGTGTPAP